MLSPAALLLSIERTSKRQALQARFNVQGSCNLRAIENVLSPNCFDRRLGNLSANMATKYAFTQGLREVRFHLCSSSQASEAARTFLKRAYPTMKHHNPNTPILIREATGVDPKIWARYGLGKEKSQSLAGLSDKEIEDTVTTLVKSE
ncbi:NADH dehydrogenase (ubiquinone) 1 alpha subcomplex 2 [Exophiala aquamarina CBS 119918]|uniref:NADH dehydrogenase (Ubiquinone) 1 alpha subcomplex 2 n=1 Tax=Exophiala aquamarina CBS 119918 TaxID=1182545 RepID=A0A072PQA7_9EURO|nr:NADH dehydrogenase (ubiquinone) 1 alpha subcomplex 2 [Exophiala aquamarina CBS 119918]KEF61922.1 NADH dehydrogenase (ubiquinone) 1 alpha subcomplex 2 [Exophiala aquamarina CBS 119918]